MKQEVSTYLFTLKETLSDLSRYLYENPEESFHEYKACSYIIDLLKKHDFNVTENFLQMPTSFHAEKGGGHPKVCFLCEYDAVPGKGHITGHNLVTSISLGAGLALTKALGTLTGTVIIIGCPGELIGGSKVTMAKQGVFDDIDAVLMVHPDNETAQSGTSSAVLPIAVKYTGLGGFSYMKADAHSPLDACLLTFTALNMLMKGFPRSISIDGVINNGGSTPSLLSGETEAKFYIRASTMKEASNIENKLRELVKTVSSLMDINSEISLYELPCDELLTNPTLSRIFCHNLKECGIIDCSSIKNTTAGLSLGTVSHHTPTINQYISITENSSTVYFTPEFAEATLSQYGQEIALKAAQALALTGLDLLQNNTLAAEAKNEFFKTQKA